MRLFQKSIAIIAIGLACLSNYAAAVTSTTDYRYDDLGRTTEVNYINSAKHNYTYDAANNRTQKVVTLAPDVTPPGKPGAVTFSAIAMYSITATWTAATDNRAVTDYEYSYTGSPTWKATGNALTVNLASLIPNTSYTFYVRAKDAAGNIGETVNATFTTATDSVPPVFTASNVSILSTTSTSATLSWPAATDNVAVTAYEYSLTSGMSWNSLSVSNTLSTTISSLTPSTAYICYIRAKDAAGNNSSSITGMFTTAGNTPPTKPGSPLVSSINLTSAVISWSAASDDVAVVGYQYSLNNGSSWASIGNNLFTTISNLTPSTTYPVWIRAIDSANAVGEYSVNTFTTLADTIKPTLPGTPTFSGITNTTASASWSGASDNIAVTSYEYSYNGGAWISAGLSLSANLSGLTKNINYTLSVRAKDAAGNVSDASSATFKTTNIDNTPPTQPGTPQFYTISTNSAGVSWTVSTDDVGVTSYEYSFNNSTWVSVGNNTSSVLTSLAMNTTYTLYVRAKDAAGNISTYSSNTFKTIDADITPPTKPGVPNVPDMSYPTAPVSWTAATDNIGVVSYEYTLDYGATWINVGNNLSTTISGLVVGQNYSIYVRARDLSGNFGESSSKAFTTVDSIVPTVPGTLVLTNLTPTSLTVSWAASTDNIGVVSYEYFLYSDNPVVNVNVGNVLTKTITGLTPGSNYGIYVRARDAAGNVSVSSFTSFATPVQSITISNLSVVNPYIGGTATYGLATDGYIKAYQSQSNSIVALTRWIATGLNTSNYEERATLTSSTACTNGYMSTWMPIYAAGWAYTAPNVAGAPTGCSFTLEVREKTNPSVILGTAQISLTAGNTR